jgi:putative endonuclease
VNRAETGHRGEAAAARWYQKQGCRLLAHNFHTRMGELDVVVQEPDGTIVICEVKTRAEGSLASPAEAVDRPKQRRLIRAAQYYLQQNGLSDAPVRFDVAEVFPLDSGRWMVHIIRGAFLT